MSDFRPPFKCVIHKNILTDDFCSQHKDLMRAAYYSAAPMAELSIELSRALNSSLVMLPADYVAEAEAYGVELIGYNDIFGLRPGGTKLKSVSELSDLPPMDFTRGRLAEIIKAISLIDEAGYTPCLSITGFFSLLEILLPMEQVFISWRKRQAVLLNFLKEYEKSLLEYIALALQAGAKVISYSDPLTSLEILGRNNGRQIAEELILPFFSEISQIPQKGIIHICGLSSDILAAAGVPWIEIDLDDAKNYSQAIAEQALSVEGIKFFGFGCLNHERTSKKLTQLCYTGTFLA
jgi:uroporphyrinogen-III decarboxylase